MSLYCNILFPIDFSDQSKAVAPYIADIANRFQAKLHLLHVSEEKRNTSTVRGRVSEHLIGFAASMPIGMHCSQALSYGRPAETIVRYAESQGIDLIAMPTSGKGRLRRSIFGSTTEEVLRQAPCAVWTESGSGHPHMRWSPVLCAIDLESGSEPVLSYAASVAEQLYANLIVVHAIPPISEGLLMQPSDLPSALSYTEAQCALEVRLQELNLFAEPVVEMGAVTTAVSRVAVQTRAKLLVVGRGGHGSKRIGTHTHDFVANAPCPVLTSPRAPAVHRLLVARTATRECQTIHG